MAKIKIALLRGGFSNESKVSLETAKEIYKNLDKKKFKIIIYDPKKDLNRIITDAKSKKFDIVIPALHGFFGEDGKIQGIIETFGIPFLFSNSLASAIAMNKNISKIIAENSGLKTIKSITIKKHKRYNIDDIIKKIHLPIIIKPAESGSSIGISIADNKKELEKGIKHAFNFGEEIIIEMFIKGREFTVGVYEDNQGIKTLPIIEIIPKISKWFDYKAKYEDRGSDEICPAEIPTILSRKMQRLAAKIFKRMNCKDLARVDFIFDEKKKIPYFIEINTIPGMTKNSLIPRALRTAKIEISFFLETLIAKNLKNV